MTFQAREATDRWQGIYSGLGPVAEDGTGGSDDSECGKTDKDIPADDDE